MMNKKKTILAAALVVAIVALAGVGYAALSPNVYKGETSSVASDYDVDWVIVSLGETGYAPVNTIHIAFDTATAWDTTTSAPKTTFKWLGSDEVTHNLQITIPADISGDNANNRDRDSFTLKAEVTFSSSIYKLQYSITDGTWVNYTSSAALATGQPLDFTAGYTIQQAIKWRLVACYLGLWL